jgi:O-antigen ligase
MRRVALGLAAALVTARAYWPSEPDVKSGAGAGLSWALALLLVLGLALLASFIGGRFRFRWSWGDLAFYVLVFLVATSATHAIDRRVAMNQAWEWVGLGCAYLLLRNLPRVRGESSVLAGALVATAVAVSTYAVYQVSVELPQIRAEFQRHPQRVLRNLGIEPGSPGEIAFKNRLMGSNEPWSTFALPNSLAGFIVGPLALLLAVGLQNLVNRQAPGSRWGALAMAAPLALVVSVCVVLTKSRSSWVGLAVSLGYIAWRARRHVPVRVLMMTGLAGLAFVLALVGAGLATRRLDPEVLTQTGLSARYRWEYWQGTWGVITGGASDLRAAVSSPLFWKGVGPANFGGPYLRHKLPQASEEIRDPHNLFLDVWVTAGFAAFVALVAALAISFGNLLGPYRSPVDVADSDPARLRGATARGRRSHAALAAPGVPADSGDAAPEGVGWLIACAGAGWVMAALVGQLNPFQGDLFIRWLILGASWLAAVFFGAPLWRRLPLPAWAPAAGAAAVTVSLLAAGGIGISAVALGLWSLLALALNLRDELPCSQLREYFSRWPSFGVAAAWAALVGTFVGVTLPFWRCQKALDEADVAMLHRPPDYDSALASYAAAGAADRYDSRPWRDMAYLNWAVWQERGAKLEDQRWKTIPILLHRAATPPRNPLAWSLHLERAVAMTRLLEALGGRLSPQEELHYRAKVVEATRTAARLYPSNPELHARLAEASASVSMYQDAVDEANEALRLDLLLTPHPDKRLSGAVRDRLMAQIPKWTESAANAAPRITPP